MAQYITTNIYFLILCGTRILPFVLLVNSSYIHLVSNSCFVFSFQHWKSFRIFLFLLDGWCGLFIFIKPLIISGIYSHSAEASHYEEASVSARQRNVSLTKHYAFCRVPDPTNFHLNTDNENCCSIHTTLILASSQVMSAVCPRNTQD